MELLNFTIDTLINLIIFQVYFIVYLFLREVGLFLYIYESIYTHPLLTKYLNAIGDYFYGIGISVVGGAVVILFQEGSIKLFIVLMLIGKILVISGALLKNRT